MPFFAHKEKDAPLVDSKDTDIVIPVMGPAGVGKSSFINKCLVAFGLPEAARVGEGLSSCTDSLDTFPIESAGGTRVILVDTPGFDDPFEVDMSIFRRISRWRNKSYGRKIKEFGGVVYMHDIAQDRLAGAASRTREHLHLLKKNCGSAPDKVVFVTSKWTQGIDLEKLDRREKELRDFHWDKMVGPQGASVRRLRPGEEWNSAAEIIDSIVKRVKEERAKGVMERDQRQEMLSKLRKKVSNIFSGSNAAALHLDGMRPMGSVAAVWVCGANAPHLEGDIQLDETLAEKLRKVERRLNKRFRQLLVSV